MTEWTPSAREAWEEYCRRVRSSLADTGADANEVIDDLKRHLDTEVAAARLEVVTGEDVHRMVAELGLPEKARFLAETPSDSRIQPATAPETKLRKKPGLWVFFFGVVLPAVTLGIEGLTHLCAGVFFDPIPTLAHCLLVAWVPLANVWVWRAARREAPCYHPGLGWANSIALGIALFYALVFLPLVPPGAVALIFFGWGLLPLAPLLSLVATASLRRRLREMGQVTQQAGYFPTWRGVLVGLAAMVALQLPETLTRIGLQLADSEKPSTQELGIRWLRSVGRQETLLRACYDRPRRFIDFTALVLSARNPVLPEDARTIYYRVTGQAFNAVPPPKLYARGGVWGALDEEFTWEPDSGLGGEAVAGRVSGLTLHSSRLDGVVEADHALAYVEWTMEFKNTSRTAREARAQVQLPPGGVVSRLTLWVNGEPREAAFAGRAEVREAYQQVAVEQRRDPVLVTTSGPDQILIQCFPVPQNGGSLRIRLGITLPLDPASQREGALRWPAFLERNFSLSPDLRHLIWIESGQPVESAFPALRAAPVKPDRYGLRGELRPQDLEDPQAAIRVKRTSAWPETWTPADAQGQSIHQVVREEQPQSPTRLAVVIDGSTGMQPVFPILAPFLQQLPATMAVNVILAGDRPEVLSPSPADANLGEDSTRRLAAGLRSLREQGGQDNLPALVQAWDWAVEGTNSVILWLHGPQPIMGKNPTALRQRLERHPAHPTILSLQTRPGPNRIREQLGEHPAFIIIPRAGEVDQDLAGLLARWRGQAPSFSIQRHRAPYPGPQANVISGPANQHVERLWALQSVRQLMAQRQRRDAVELAARYHLVTPVSGAVVLESQAQYDQANLKPAEAATVPIVPEPAVWLLLVLGGALLAFAKDRHR